MNRSSLPIIAITLAAFSAAPAMAADAHAPDSRHHVQTELAEAVRTGELLADGESGLKRNELFPGNYPAKPSQPGETRAQVKAELAEATRTGDMLADGESGLKRNELFPGNYPARSTEPGKTRAQVQAELFEAIRTGTMPVHSGA